MRPSTGSILSSKGKCDFCDKFEIVFDIEDLLPASEIEDV